MTTLCIVWPSFFFALVFVVAVTIAAVFGSRSSSRSPPPHKTCLFGTAVEIYFGCRIHRALFAISAEKSSRVFQIYESYKNPFFLLRNKIRRWKNWNGRSLWSLWHIMSEIISCKYTSIYCTIAFTKNMQMRGTQIHDSLASSDKIGGFLKTRKKKKSLWYLHSNLAVLQCRLVSLVDGGRTNCEYFKYCTCKCSAWWYKWRDQSRWTCFWLYYQGNALALVAGTTI